MYTSLLYQIANTLLLNTQYYTEISLLKGRQGVVLFLYHFSLYIKSNLYSDFSDGLLNIEEQLVENCPTDFKKGLSGVGWSIDYLIKNNFIEADEDTLEDIDKTINAISTDNLIKELDVDIPLFSKGLYFLQRDLPNFTYEALLQCEELLSKDSVKIPLMYANSIFYVANRALSTHHGFKNIYKSILAKLFIIIKANIIKKETSLLDSYLLNKNIKNIVIYNEKSEWNSLLQESQRPPLLEVAWANFIFKYDDDETYEIEKTEVQKIINDTWNSYPEELCLCNGLAGVGLEILRNIKLMHESS